jgi:hypothetical protein
MNTPSLVRRLVASFALTIGPLAAGVAAQTPTDRVRLVTGGELQGQIVDVSPNGLDLETRDGPKKLSIEAIRDVRLAGEPEELRDARNFLLRKDGAAALDELGKIAADELAEFDERITQEIAFVRSGATARRALSTGEGLPAAQKAVAEYLAANQRSLHFYAMQELLGDLLAAQGKPGDAATAYAALDKGPPAIEVRAATLKADLLFRQGMYAEAQKEYEAAAKAAAAIAGDTGPRAARAALLGRARCLIRQAKAGDAVGIVMGIVAGTEGDDESLGKAYNVLGDAWRATAGKERDAILAFLTVDLVHNELPDDHAEALFNLVELWGKVNFPERAREARQTLETAYPNSPWTKKLVTAKAP